MQVIDLKQDNKGMKFSVAGRMATIILKRGKKFAKADLGQAGFSAEEITRHRDAAHFLIAIDKMSLWSGKRSWLGQILRWLRK